MKYIFKISAFISKGVKYAGFVLVVINTMKYFSEEIDKLNTSTPSPLNSANTDINEPN